MKMEHKEDDNDNKGEDAMVEQAGPKKKWDAQSDGTLLKLLSEGQSASEICIVLGRTRNSVIGRSYRLRKGPVVKGAHGLTPVVKPKRRYTPRPKIARSVSAAPKASARRTTRKSDPTGRRRRAAVLRMKCSGAEPRLNCDIHDLTNGVCRYIVSGEGEPVLYCGDTTQYKSFCAKHAGVCYENSFEVSHDISSQPL